MARLSLVPEYRLELLMKSVALQKIRVEFNVRPKVNEEFIEELAKSIESEGLKVPIIVDRDYVLIDGLHRFEALKRIQKDIKVPIIVMTNVSYRENPYKAILYAYIINRERIGASDTQFKQEILKEMFLKLLIELAKEVPEDKLRIWINDFRRGIIPNEVITHIAKKCEISESTVYRYLAALLLKPNAREVIIEELLKVKESTKIVEFVEERQPSLRIDFEKLREIARKSVSISKVESIKKIVEKVGEAEVDVEKLDKLSKRELEELSKIESKEKLREELEKKLREKEEREVTREFTPKTITREITAFEQFWRVRDAFGSVIKFTVFDMLITELAYEFILKFVELGVNPKDVVELIRKLIDAFKSEDEDQVRQALDEWLTLYRRYRLKVIGG